MANGKLSDPLHHKANIGSSLHSSLLGMQMRPKFYPRICPFDVDGGRSKSHRRRQRQVVLARLPRPAPITIRQSVVVSAAAAEDDGGKVVAVGVPILSTAGGQAFRQPHCNTRARSVRPSFFPSPSLVLNTM